MIIADILNSCGHERVAEAAVVSIGGSFARGLEAMARTCNVSVGTLTVALVRRFAIDATERDWRYVSAATRSGDFPLLCGLRAIVERIVSRPVVAQAPKYDESFSAFACAADWNSSADLSHRTAI